MTPADTGPLRGIVLHVYTSRAWKRYGRHVSSGMWLMREKYQGQCLWCLRPLAAAAIKRSRLYHRPCKRMKDGFAFGFRLRTGPHGKKCAKCGLTERVTNPDYDAETPGSRQYIHNPERDRNSDNAFELDHRVAISIASEMAGVKGWARALMPGNLQWLCHACHATKTAADRRTLNALHRTTWPRQDREAREDPNQVGLSF